MGACRNLPVSLGEYTMTTSSMSFTRALSSAVSSMGSAYEGAPERNNTADMILNLFIRGFCFGMQSYDESSGGAILIY